MSLGYLIMNLIAYKLLKETILTLKIQLIKLYIMHCILLVNLMEKNNELSKSKLKKYLANEFEDPSDTSFDILIGWKAISSKYLILLTVARDVLVISMSVVASKITFSIRGCVLYVFKSSLNPATIKALILFFYQNWIPVSPSSIDLSQIINDLEKLEKLKLHVF
jgi:hypothetical protein